MDFLDPKKRRNHTIRLMIGYVLVAIAILLATIVLVYAARGYSINTKNGNVVQNSLVFVDSKPGGASIYLNGQQKGNTSARLVLAVGSYSLKLTKSGYRDWQRTIALDTQTVGRFVYPLLFPVKPRITNMKSYSAQPSLVSETPDHHYLLVQIPSADPSTISFDQFDTTKLDQAPVVLSLPAAILTGAGEAGSTLTDVEWSTDNSHWLLKHTYAGGSEFIIFDRALPSDSINVNKALNTNPTDVQLRDEKTDQLYIYDAAAQTVSVGDTAKDTVDPAFLSHVLAFKGYGTSLMSYITDYKVPAGQVQARIWDNGKTYALVNLAPGSTYLIDAAQYQNDWYYAAGSSANDHIYLFKDPLNSLQSAPGAKALSFISLRVANASKIGFSTNTRFIEAESGQVFGVFDFETQMRYQYTVQKPLAGPLQWMDGHRLIGESGGQVYVMDYDGINQQLLTPTNFNLGGYFSNDYNHLLTTAPGSDATTTVLENVDMRAGNDLPTSTQ